MLRPFLAAFFMIALTARGAEPEKRSNRPEPTDPGCADIMRLEGTKKWLPGRVEGFEDLIDAVQTE